MSTASKVEWYSEFVDLGYRPTESDLICLFRMEPAEGFDVAEAAGRVASESSCGTWTTITTMKPRIRRLMAKAYEIHGNHVKVAYPLALFEAASIPQIFSSIAGNIFGMKAVANLRLEDVQWPRKVVAAFSGPQFGIAGVRRLLRVPDRPLTATVPKPKVGLTAEEHAEVGYAAWRGGIDLLKDDENLTSQSFNRFESRVKKSLRLRDKAERETGDRKSYLINITAETREMLRRARFVKEQGGEYVMVDILTVGWAALQTVREECQDFKLAIHGHRAFHAAFTRNRRHGMSMLVVAEAARLIGVDQLHVGTVIGKLESPKEEVEALVQKLRLQEVRDGAAVLPQNWGRLTPVLPVTSGGLHPGLIPAIIELLGRDIVIQIGGGLWGHPRGAEAGARAIRQALDAALAGTPLTEYAQTHREIQEALAKWGTGTYR